MIGEIINEWAQFCKDMGCTLATETGMTVATNRDSYLACDFANCAISLGETPIDINGLERGFEGHDFVIYKIQKETDNERYSAISLKMGTLMMINSKEWSAKTEYNMRKNNEVVSSKTIFRFSARNLNIFRDVVFDAFSYEQRFRESSLDTYIKGEGSGNVRYYGLQVLGQGVVSAAMIHASSRGDIGGLELVSTRPQFQNLGYSKFLLGKILNEEFDLNLKKIWLFSITGSFAEKFYRDLGFINVGNIKILRFSGR